MSDEIKQPHERLLTVKQVAAELGLPCWKLQRAVKHGDLPSYSPFNSRKLLRLSEVRAAIDATRVGGSQ